MTVNVLYDGAVFFTNKDMEEQCKGNIAVQPLWDCHKFTSCHRVVHHKLRTTSIILKNAMQGDLLQKEIKKHLKENLKEEMGGIQRIPAMMFVDQEKSTG